MLNNLDLRRANLKHENRLVCAFSPPSQDSPHLIQEIGASSLWINIKQMSKGHDFNP